MLKSIDFFCGAGGFTEGLSQAGFECLLATDVDEMAGKTFAFNHPKTPLLIRPIENISLEDILLKAGDAATNIDLMVGGPPCQGFSLAGRRLAEDPRNRLFLEFRRFVDMLRPKVFIMENVVGLTTMMKGQALEAILSSFEELGYNCKHSILNSADFGVPQSRLRFILIGTRLADHPGFPEPTHRAQQKNGGLFDDELPLHITSWEALSNLPAIQQGEGSEELRVTLDVHNDYQRQRIGRRDPGIIYNHRATSHSPSIIERYSAIPEGGDNSMVPEHLRTKKINVFKIDGSKPSRTVTCNHRTDLLHPKIPRGTTVRDAARLQSFDDDYRFFGNLTRKAKYLTQDDQVGNAVPPLLARALGLHMKKYFMNRGDNGC